MNFNFNSFVADVMNLLTNWFFAKNNNFAWCRVKVDNRYDKNNF